MATLVVNTTTDFRGGAAETNIDAITFAAPATATFGSDQFGAGLISDTVKLTGSGGLNIMRVILAAEGAFSAAKWTFATWGIEDRIELQGTDGVDTITGSAREDTILGGLGADILKGGASSDFFDYKSGSEAAPGEQIDGGGGVADTIRLLTGNLNLSSATIIGVERFDFVSSGGVTFAAGQIGAGAINVIDGGPGNDQLRIEAPDGEDIDFSGVTFANWTLGSDQIQLIGGSTFNSFEGSNQSDIFIGGSGSDKSVGGDGDDVFRFLIGSDVGLNEEIQGGAGTGDSIELAGPGKFNFSGKTIAGVERLNFAEGGATAQIFSDLFGTGKIATVNASTVADALIVQAASDVASLATVSFVNWNSAVDTITVDGELLGNNLTGSTQNDIIHGNIGRDTMKGGGGNDIFTYEAVAELDETETVNGQAGTDAVQVAAGSYDFDAEKTLFIDVEELRFAGEASATFDQDQFGSATAKIVSVVGDVGQNAITINAEFSDLTPVVFLNFEQGVDTLTIVGSSTGNALIGSSFGDTINGNAGADTINGGGGADLLNGGADKDSMTGGAGDDVFRVGEAGDTVAEVAGEGTADRVITTVSYGLTKGAEVELLTTNSSTATVAFNLTGNTLKQEITGNAGDNALNDGGIGASDTMKGLGGNDTYRVFNSGDVIVEGSIQGTNDRVTTSVDYVLGKGAFIELFTTNGSGGTSDLDLTGNEIAQEILGNDGDNRLEGKGGADTLRGFGGKDSFTFATALGAGNIDTIVDFIVVDDRFLLSDAIFTELDTGTLSATAFRANTTGLAQDANDHIIYETDTGKLFYDEDGTGAIAGIQFAGIAANLALTNADFSVA